MSCARTRHQCLRWDAAVIDTSAAESLALDNRHLHSCASQPNRKRWSCLPSANNDRIIFSCHRVTSARVTFVYNFQGSYQPLRTTCTLSLTAERSQAVALSKYISEFCRSQFWVTL